MSPTPFPIARRPVPPFPSLPAARPKLRPKFSPLPVAQLDRDGSFRGYASLFNRVDLGRDLVLPGAFRRSVARRGVRGIRMLYQHDPAQVIGTWRVVREDPAGLFVEGHLSPDVAKAREVRSLMRAGALDGLSIGFHTVRATKDAATGVRSIIEADLWEVSVVTFPMLPDARVAEVKTLSTPSPRATPREIETMLRRDAGLSRREAKAAVAATRGPSVAATRATPRTPREAAFAPPTDPLAARIRDAALLFQR